MNRILIIEDEEAILELIGMNLEAAGYEAVRLLAEGKTCRVVAANGDDIVNYDITEALGMTKGLDQRGLEVMRALTGFTE